MNDTVKRALKISKINKVPVFPTKNKKPALSNKQLSQILDREVKRGEGGFKMATTKPAQIKALFEAANTDEIAVPMGPKSRGGAGYLVVDVDSYKDEETLTQWVEDNRHLLEGTLTHITRSGGTHYIFQFPEGVTHPSTLRPGIDLKGFGGYICWPGTPGYEMINDVEPLPFPMALLNGGGVGHNGPPSSTWSESTDEELVDAIRSAKEMYPALRTLAWRMADVPGISHAEAEKILETIMQNSVATDLNHPRHEDWAERYEKIEELVSSAWDKRLYPGGSMPDRVIEALAAEGSDVFEKFAVQHKPEHRQVPEVDAFHAEPKRTIPPRAWLYGHHMVRAFLTSTVAPGGMGKSSLIIAEALSLVSGQELLGVKVHHKLRVLYWCGEDPKDELQRRFSATMDHYGLSNDDLGGRLYVMSGREMGLNLAYRDHQDAVISDADVKLLVDTLRKLEIDLLICDPMVSLHSVNENSNDEMSMVLDALRDVADRENVGIELVHHSTKEARKSGAGMGAEQVRGASAIVDACRSVRALSNLTKTDAEEAGLTSEQARAIVTIRSVKGNMSPGERSSAVKLVSVQLNNGTAEYPDGDAVGVVEPTVLDRSAMTDWADSLASQMECLDLISTKAMEPWRKDPRSADWVGACLLRSTGQKDDASAKRFVMAMLERLEEDGFLTIYQIKSPNGTKRPCYQINQDRVDEIREILR